MIIAGIGSRKTPIPILRQIEKLGAYCLAQGIWVRSGHALGADYAWERSSRERCIVYLPFPGYGPAEFHTKQITSLAPTKPSFFPIHPAALERAQKSVTQFHKGSQYLTPFARQCHTRNYFQIMGSREQERPVDAVVCWTPLGKRGQATGGTKQALSIAAAHDIPIFNLFHDFPEAVLGFLKSHEHSPKRRGANQ
ncbi:MAG: hypothetical protein P1V97_08135 [Planctomycetota bacterium]|nr:hypothetical protein [Planctomycetota bacterium]